MRIISEFKDYYDNVDRSPEPLFIRETWSNFDYEQKHNIELNLPILPSYIPRYDVSISYIGFCGVIYPRVYIRSINSVICGINSLEDYAIKSVVDWARAKVFIDHKADQSIWDISPIWFFAPGSGRHRVNRKYPFYDAIISPKLDDFKFQKTVDPYQASQRLSMWFNNIARPRNKIPEMDNNTKIELAGFNIKTSFRSNKK